MAVERRQRSRHARAGGCCLLIAAVGVLLAVPQADARGVEPAPVRPGQASASSSVLGVVVRTGGTVLRPTAIGRASAAYVETQTQAASATFDPGGAGFLLSAIPICGQVLLPAGRQPQPLTASSADGPSSTTTGGNVGGVGTQSVSVSASPQLASATTKPITQTLLGGLLQVEGTATSTVRYLDGAEQQAESSVTADVALAGGLVRLDGMRWSASRHVGAAAASSADFSFGTVSITGTGSALTVPSDVPAAAVVTAINTAIAPSGLVLTLPVGSNDATKTAIGPLQVHFAGSSLENRMVSPAAQQLVAIEAVAEGRSANGTDCTSFENLIGNLANPAATVANIAIGVMQGAGSLDVDLGGAYVGIQGATDYSDPFAAGLGGRGAAVPGDQASAGGGATPVVSTASPAGSGSTPPRAAEPTGILDRAAALVRCTTTSSAGRPGCWAGAGPLAGGLAAFGAAGFLVADVVISRRPRRRHGRSPAGA